MVKFKDVQFEALGEFIRDLIKDPAKQAVFRSGDQEGMKALLKGFMTPRGKTWERAAHVSQSAAIRWTRSGCWVDRSRDSERSASRS